MIILSLLTFMYINQVTNIVPLFPIFQFSNKVTVPFICLCEQNITNQCALLLCSVPSQCIKQYMNMKIIHLCSRLFSESVSWPEIKYCLSVIVDIMSVDLDFSTTYSVLVSTLTVAIIQLCVSRNALQCLQSVSMCTVIWMLSIGGL